LEFQWSKRVHELELAAICANVELDRSTEQYEFYNTTGNWAKPDELSRNITTFRVANQYANHREQNQFLYARYHGLAQLI